MDKFFLRCLAAVFFTSLSVSVFSNTEFRAVDLDFSATTENCSSTRVIVDKRIDKGDFLFIEINGILIRIGVDDEDIFVNESLVNENQHFTQFRNLIRTEVFGEGYYDDIEKRKEANKLNIYIINNGSINYPKLKIAYQNDCYSL